MRPLGLGWPNVLSIGRIALIPIVVALLSVDRPETRWVAFAVFVENAGSSQSALNATAAFLKG